MAESQPNSEQPESEAKQTQRQPVEIDESGAMTSYANFCRVTGTPEELIIDFGLNTQPFGVPTQPVKVSQRLVSNFYTAKRLMHALHMAIERHEQAFGVIEVDVQKRVTGNQGGSA